MYSEKEIERALYTLKSESRIQEIGYLGDVYYATGEGHYVA